MARLGIYLKTNRICCHTGLGRNGPKALRLIKEELPLPNGKTCVGAESSGFGLIDIQTLSRRHLFESRFQGRGWAGDINLEVLSTQHLKLVRLDEKLSPRK